MGDRVRLIGGSGGGAPADLWTPESPRTTVDTTYSLPTGGTTWTVNDGEDLQATFTAVQPGDVIVIEAGAEFRGNYTFPAKVGSGDIYIISSALASLPAEGTRVAPSDAPNMPRISTPTPIEHAYNSYQPVLQTSQDASNLRFVGIRFGSNYDIRDALQRGFIRIGYPHDYDQPPADKVIFDRCYIHGTTTGNNRDGIVTYRVATFAVIDSYLSEWHAVSSESHAIHLYTLNGPAKIHNNYIEAAAINVFIADSVMNANFPTPSDLTFTDNYLFKPLSWQIGHPSYAGIHWRVKNHFETKGSERVVFTGNICENVWHENQTGMSWLLKSDARPVHDTRIENNICINFKQWVNISDQIGNAMHRMLIQNNLGYRGISDDADGTTVALASAVTHGFRYLQILHNTLIAATTPLEDYYKTWMNLNGELSVPEEMEYIRVKDNIVPHGRYGLKGTSVAVGWLSAEHYTSERDFDTNVMIDVPSGAMSSYADNVGFVNFLEAVNLAAVGFVDTTFDNIPGDFALSGGSAYHNAATDGTDIGVDVSQLPAYS